MSREQALLGRELPGSMILVDDKEVRRLVFVLAIDARDWEKIIELAQRYCRECHGANHPPHQVVRVGNDPLHRFIFNKMMDHRKKAQG